MKRQYFRLNSVLRFYDVQKRRAELELRDASQKLRRADLAIHELDRDIDATAAILQTDSAALSLAGWLICYRKIDQLKQQRQQAQAERERQAAVVKKLEEARMKWSIKEETLHSLKRSTEDFNRDQTAKAQQELLDETVMRQWLENQQALELKS
jgi:predicted translin family RNA/ssDNA-binding protein